MLLTVIGKEVRKFDDTNFPGVQHTRVKLHCTHDPRRVDQSAVLGSQVLAINFFDDNVLFSDVFSLPIPCIIDAELEKVNNFTNIIDFKKVD